MLCVPVAHHDGNYFADAATLDRLEDEGQVAFRYCDADGELTAEANPNGSARNIAGVFNDTKNVLGLMPHPENAIDPLLGSTDGQALFDGARRGRGMSEAGVMAAPQRPDGPDARGIRSRRQDPRPAAEPDRARHLLGDVERALLLQILEEVAEDAADRGDRG